MIANFVVAVAVICVAYDDAEVELSSVVCDAQKANKARYNHGRTVVAIESRDRATNKIILHGQAECIWDGPNIRTAINIDLTLKPGQILGVNPANNKKTDSIISTSEIHCITKDEYISYSKNSLKATILAIAESEPEPNTLLRPADLWYGKVEGRGVDWLQQFSRDPNNPSLKESVYRIKRIGNNIEFKRNDSNGIKFSALISLPEEGNVISFADQDSETGLSTTGSYEWRTDFKGRFVLKQAIVERLSTNPQWPLNDRTVYNIVEFDPDYRPSPSSFALPALAMATGTVVEDSVRKRTFQVGSNPSNPSGKVSDSLGGIVDKIKKRGFANPNRQ